ncbi:MAG: NADH-quinone oxidoreductase subunit M [Acidocella sp. 20-57-95]|nr:MAG: NADH-quinone oxidoreductase subunit M [Acidocella sp. 20-57-95]OYV60416.1 MAG: NADH-quinone oxidoreductase subunit M [Acidocella sp. 21-58-7]HQT63212.1 NADH-quinone oxidoreductase subunit M [Acidocella sp.]HQU03538.1 NADH-quinone oxidoreductase subunit M [Acidocella sp.]
MNSLSFPILSLITFLPLAGVLFIASVRGDEASVARNVRWAALWTSLIVLALSVYLWISFDPAVAGFQFIETSTWLSGLDVQYRMGVDGISLFLVLLTAFITPIAIIASWSITKRVREFMIAFLLLETMTIGMFCALDFVVFYIFFEAVLLPMYLIIGVWGGEKRIFAAVKFFLFTLTGSVLMLLALVWMWRNAGTTDIVTLLRTPIPPQAQTWLFIAFLASFGVKAAVWPLHTWLPDAYGEAPLPGTIMLAAVLSKMGAYGFLRFTVPMLPHASAVAAPLMFTFGVVAVIYVSLVALAQTDMKRLIAYSSVAHMGVIIIGIFTFTVEGIEGALFQMLSHGVIIAGLFICAGVLLARGEGLALSRLGGLAVRMPAYATLLMLFALGSMGLPGTSGFVGEILVIVGAMKVNFWVSLLGATGMVLGAAYMLVMLRAVLFDKFTSPSLDGLKDLRPAEYAMLVPLAVMVLWLGIYPASFTHIFDAPVNALVQAHTAALTLPQPAAPASLAMVIK